MRRSSCKRGRTPPKAGPPRRARCWQCRDCRRKRPRGGWGGKRRRTVADFRLVPTLCVRTPQWGRPASKPLGNAAGPKARSPGDWRGLTWAKGSGQPTPVGALSVAGWHRNRGPRGGAFSTPGKLAVPLPIRCASPLQISAIFDKTTSPRGPELARLAEWRRCRREPRVRVRSGGDLRPGIRQRTCPHRAPASGIDVRGVS